jgi:arylformamidase
MTKIFRDYDQAALDAQYDQATLVPDLGPYLRHWREGSAAARSELTCETGVAYGRHPAERLDIFRARRPGTPVHLNFHGGAWKLLDKDDAAYAAPTVVAAGGIYVAVGFGLVPEVTLAEQVRQARAAVAWTWRNIVRFGGDPARLFVSGHSSGAHLVGCLVADGWHDSFGVPRDVVKGAVAASGIYDLAPVRLSSRNAYLHLTDLDVERLSPIRHIARGRAPELSVFWAAGDLAEFRRQSADFAAAWRSAGHSVEVLELEGHNHFDVANGFGDPDGPIGRAIRRQLVLEFADQPAA